jgi:hypothetical protein
VRIVRLALCLRLQRAGLGADVMGTGPSSEGARVGAFMLTTLSGFWKSEAILATSLLGPMPTEAVSPSWLTISALSRLARSTAASKLPSDESSRYASSTLVFWKASPAATRIAMIRAETSR